MYLKCYMHVKNITQQPIDVWCQVMDLSGMDQCGRITLRGVPTQGEITAMQPAVVEGDLNGP